MLNLAPGFFMHYKGGYYEVLGLVTAEDSGNVRVLYRSMHDGTYWTRTVDNFTEKVTVEGKEVRRFARLSQW